jgi:Trk K+ transport system NAD-binding subunit
MAPALEKLITRVVGGFAGLTHHETKKTLTIIVGANEGPRLLAAEIAKTDSPVMIIDSDPELCRVASNLPLVEVIQGDPTDVEVLRQAGAEHAASVFVTTSNDQKNLAICETVEMHFNPNRLLARVNEKKNLPDFEVLGYDVMSLARAALTLIECSALTPELRELLRETDEGELLAEISVTSPVIIGRQLSGIPMSGTDLIELRRRGHPISIDRSTSLQIGDLLTLFGSGRAIEDAAAELNPQC